MEQWKKWKSGKVKVEMLQMGQLKSPCVPLSRCFRFSVSGNGNVESGNVNVEHGNVEKWKRGKVKT